MPPPLYDLATLSLVSLIDRAVYPGVESDWDDRAFRALIQQYLRREMTVLDVGAGAGIVEPMRFRGAVHKVIGVDLDPRVMTNPHLDEAHIASADAMAFLPDESIDVAFSDNVLEHLDEPDAVFREIHRVIRPGGVLLTKTPNRHHYVATFARMTPHWFHQSFNRLRGRDAEDTFPTRYKANSQGAQRRLAEHTGFALETFQPLESRPEYLRVSALTYPFGIAWERAVNGLSLDAFKVVLLSVFRRR